MTGELESGVDGASEPSVLPGKASSENLSPENRLAAVRLGIATSLFYALRAKHVGAAEHSLRVAMICSVWADRMGLEDQVRDRIEVAALLHDIGKIGMADRILRKPGKLTVDERLEMDRCPDAGCQILSGCTDDNELLEIVRYCGTWFESRRGDDSFQGQALPLGARLLAVADAFDAMTTDHVYRAAMSQDRAVSELMRGAGTQFDPDLVIEFCRMLDESPELLRGKMVDRWLHRLGSQSESLFGTPLVEGLSTDGGTANITIRRETLFNQQLSASIKDGVAFTDGEGMIQNWNLAMQRLTGVSSEAIIGKLWSTGSLGLRDAGRSRDDETACPLQQCMRSGQTIRRAMAISGAGGDQVSLHVEVAPVYGRCAELIGTVIVFHDLSDREHMEKRLESLHRQTTIDPLTGVANRAHFDQTLAALVEQSEGTAETFSLIICDLDHFKSINDTFGHPIGDEALKVFAQILRTHSREGDLVARYGGEEFLLLAGNCDNATAAKRAETLRFELEQTEIESLDGRTLTASFGVTEFQSGDTDETILARSDRALLKAKDNGRNRVVQLGFGLMSEVPEPARKASWLDWFSGGDPIATTSVDILTPVPADLAIEKLRGFIADHHAEIDSVAENQISLKLHGGSDHGGRRTIDHRISFRAIITLSEAQKDEMLTARSMAGSYTKIHLELKPTRVRDRRRREVSGASRQLLASFRCYMMGEVIGDETTG